MDLRKFDVFPKLDRQYRVSTSFGGILSITSIIVTVVLFCTEIHTYLNPPVRQRLIVDKTRPTGFTGKSAVLQRKLAVDLEIEFPYIPCHLLHIDVVDPISQLELPVESISTTFMRIDKSRKQIEAIKQDTILYTDSPSKDACSSCYDANNTKCCNTCQDVLAAYRKEDLVPPPLSKISQCTPVVTRMNQMKEEGCLITSKFQTLRLASEFHIAPGYNYNYKGWHTHNTTIFGLAAESLNLTHSINKFRFDKHEGKFPLEGLNVPQTEKGAWRIVYSADIMDNSYTANQYTLMNPPKLSSGVYFRYAINPVSAIDYYDTEPFLHLCTRLLTVVGAVLAGFRVVDSICFMFHKHTHQETIK